MENSKKTMDKIVALCKTRGFIFPGSEIYGGLANSWDYGPLGVEFKNNVKRAWWKKFVQESRYNVGLDSAIIMNPEAWVASGHLAGFSDPDSVLTAPETRSSSPVRIVRDKDHQSVGLSGLYPAGEGAGYAGGIMSAAIDGMECAEHLIEQIS